MARAPVRSAIPEATYLGWLDFRALGLSNEALRRRMIDVAGVGTDDGQTLAWTVRLSPRTAVPVSVTATVDGTPVFGGVGAGVFYRKNWNMFRLTGRGLADSAESTVVQILPDSLTILMR